MTLHLYFPVPETLRLAEHAVAASEHVASLDERQDGVSCPGRWSGSTTTACT
ncbi:hypothetical protein [Micromonospora aurantiaca]|uniref:hypothetical protein n=1 Tax=Micromonospora aurantiaca (nom. illeg.) TaxID=47850 RepID=UPI001476BAE9|nr:hypothetical protein [Micromonospora aurantiaca]